MQRRAPVARVGARLARIRSHVRDRACGSERRHTRARRAISRFTVVINVCAACGMLRADKKVESDGTVVCPECGHCDRFARLPLLIVSGASGTGKSTILRALTGTQLNAVLLDGDSLWRPELQSPIDGYAAFFDTWLRLCKNIHYSGRPVVLFGAGFGVPDNIERRI